MREISPLQKERLNYQPKLAGALANGINSVKLTLGKAKALLQMNKILKNYSQMFLENLSQNLLQKAMIYQLSKKTLV